MVRNRLYYSLKPLLPWSLRMGVRRWLAVPKRRRTTGVWPVKPGSERPPEGWPGWPAGKQFAFVLSHDVEGVAGLRKVRQLAELELSLGFRSSFNFVPEGEYAVPAELRAWLVANGFEVGVHDLRHDGKLFQSRAAFATQARRINTYLREWNAAGFRAGFMLHRLNWLHDLEVRYDASTFDTDPFEPQPQGQGTIFPFWVANPVLVSGMAEEREAAARHRPGYVELPYTLPQDSTLFLLFREQGPAIWRQKLDWVARHGGMAMVNVHPDYVQFDGERSSSRTFPVEHYAALLRHVRDQYRDAAWTVLPREVAAFAAPLRLAPPHPPRRVCMVTHSFYESDGRVTRYAEALAARGDQVEVLALRRSEATPVAETINGVRVLRVQARYGKTEQTPLSLLLPILRFAAKCAWRIHRQWLRGERYDAFHIHNIPDFLVFTAFLPRLLGTPVLLDIHDLVPEFFGSKFKAGKWALVGPLLRLMERVSAAFATHVIVANDLWLDRYTARTGTRGKCNAFINHVDAGLFAPRARARQDGRIVMLFPGGLQWHQGVDIAIRAFRRIRAALPQAEFHIYGDGNMKPQLVALARELGLDGSVRFFEPLRVQQIAGIMADADLGVVPKRADSFGNEAYSTKIMEFMSSGVPVVVSSTKIDRFYFNDSVVRFFESGNADALAAACLQVLQDEPLRRQLIENALKYADQNSWARRQGSYLGLVDALIAGDRQLGFSTGAVAAPSPVGDRPLVTPRQPLPVEPSVAP